MYLRRIIVVVLVVIALSNLTVSLALAQDPDNGKVLWEKQIWQCSRCHGDMAQGLYGRPLSNSTATEAEWIEQVRHPRQSMPAFSEAQISDEQILDIRAYVTSLPAPADDFRPQDPGASDNEGHNIFLQKRCVACHDPDVGPLNNFVQRGEEPTAAAVIAQLRTPKNNMPMFRDDQVSDDEATLIANFLAEQYALQAAPATLPTSGADMPAAEMALWLVLVGGLMLACGLMIRTLFKRRLSR
ncbi:MAG: cytochrome c [Anaerolineaceae bacterium]|nr:cytochrome c [Anaerolineaceae bacterium]